jgi:hypothetical protein
MFDSQDVYDAARALRPQLDKMLGEERASPLKRAIDEHLRLAEEGEEVDERILEFLTRDPAVRSWLRTALLDESTRGLTRDSGSQSPPGDPGHVRATHFVCPKDDCNFDWCLRRIGRPVPACPVHKVSLVLDSGEC